MAVPTLLVLVVAGIGWRVLAAPDLRYGFAAPDPWAEECLGGESNIVEVLGWAEAPVSSPGIADFGGAFKEYACDWDWQPDPDEHRGQRLSLRIVVFEDTDSSGFDGERSESAVGGWVIESEQVEGFEHGLCRRATSEVESWAFECMASDGNLELKVTSRPLGSEADFDSAAFGPGAVPIEDLTVELGELVRSAFAD
ncbi:hypothetical protein [Glycomyces endophyticus]|uniref:hypothetical protein n=1 Tax=Glycomyces endophyticus TaxID=480996 RepID=UPI0031E1ACE8